MLLSEIPTRKVTTTPRGEASWGRTRVGPEAEEMGKGGQEPLFFPWERMREAKHAGLGLASLINFSMLWTIGVFPSCLVPGLAVIRTGGW